MSNIDLMKSVESDCGNWSDQLFCFEEFHETLEAGSALSTKYEKQRAKQPGNVPEPVNSVEPLAK
jgi:hypothetical protein